MKIPETIEIGGYDFKIIFQDIVARDSHSVAGICDRTNLEIRIATKHDAGGDLPDQYIPQSLIHELLHAIDYTYNNNGILNSDEGEATISRISQGVYQVLKKLT